MNSAGAGDKLARGAHKASYLTTEKKISDKRWDDIFKDFDPESFEMPDAKKLAQGTEVMKNHEFGK